MKRFVGILFVAATLPLLSKDEPRVTVSGPAAKAMVVAVTAFESEKRGDLAHYSLQVRDGATNIEIAFLPEQDPGIRGNGSKYGDGVTYVVSKSDYKIAKRWFAR